MSFLSRLRAAGLAFRGKNATPGIPLTLDQLVRTLGLEGTPGPALSEATYYACLKVLSEAIGKMPLRLVKATPDTGVIPMPENPWYRVLRIRPNRFMSSSVFFTLMEACRQHYGNAYAWIDTRDPAHPQLWPLPPDHVTVVVDDACRLSEVPDVYYRLQPKTGDAIVLGSEDVLHFRANMTRDGLVGISVQEQLRDTIDGNLRAQKLVNKMYESGMTAKAVLQYTGSLNDANVATLIKGIEAYAKGEMKNSGVENIIPIPLGMQLTPLNLKLADNQFLEVKQYSALQIAAAFGVKPNQIGDYSKSSYASAEAQQLSFLVDTLLYAIKQYEEEISWKLLTDEQEADGLIARFDTSVLLRADQQTQISSLSTAVNSFLLTPNEARERLDLPHKPGGDRLLGNGASIPVELAGAQYNTTTQEE